MNLFSSDQNMDDDEDFFCTKHCKSNSVQDPNINMTTDIDNSDDLVVEIRTKMTEMKKTLNDKILSLQDEVNHWKNKNIDAADRDVREKNNAKVELRKKSEHIEKLIKEIEALKDSHKKELDKRQKTLDSVSNQNITLKREVSQHVQKIRHAEEEFKNSNTENNKRCRRRTR